MTKLLIVQNISREGPGLLESVLKHHNVSFDIVDLDKGDELPELADYAALVVLGGPDSANDQTEKMTNELAFVKQALGAGMPYLGICLGLQVLVKSAGGEVVQGPIKEVGFIDRHGKPYSIDITPAGASDLLLDGLASPLTVFQLHGEVVNLTATMQLLGQGTDCPNQIVKVAEKAYGIQSHFELTPEMLGVWATQDPDLIPLGNESLQAEFAKVSNTYTEIGEKLLTNFLKIAGLV